MARRKRNYIVRTGDTAATIAKQLGIDPQTLMRANTGVGNLRPGMVLGVPSPVDYGGFAKMGGAMAFVRDEIPRPPGTDYRAAYAPGVFAPAGYGPPTDYSQAYFGQQPAVKPPHAQPHYMTVPVAAQQQKGYSDAFMVAQGFVKRGNVWQLLVQTPDAVDGTAPIDTGAGDITREQYTAALYGSTPDEYREFTQGLLGSGRTSFDRIGGEDGFNLLTRRGPTGNITQTPVSGATARSMRRSSYGRNYFGGGAVLGDRSGGIGKSRRSFGHRYRSGKKDKDGDKSGRPVGRAPSHQQYGGYGGYGQGSYMPSVKQYARPNYLGLINWRI